MNVSNSNSTLWTQQSQTISPYLILLGIIDALLLLTILAGNILTICAIKLSHKLSGVLSNQFVLSLAISDIMVAVFFPCHYMFYVIETLSATRILCLLRFVFISFALASSVTNILGIAVDRYIAIVYPLHYARYMTKKVAMMIMITNWGFSLTASIIPVFWNKWEENKECTLHQVHVSAFLQFMVTPMFASIWITMLIIYIRIWREATGHARRLKESSSFQYGKPFNDKKSIQVLLLIMGCFSICWIPFLITVIVFNVNSLFIYELTLHMAIGNSCMNPIIYAWKNSKFRKIFWCLLRCKTPNHLQYNSSFITNYVPTAKTINKKNEKDFVIKQDGLESNYHFNNGKLDEESSVRTLSSICGDSLQRTSIE